MNLKLYITCERMNHGKLYSSLPQFILTTNVKNIKNILKNVILIFLDFRYHF